MSSSSLATLDFIIIFGYVAFALVIGSLFFKKASGSSEGFFVGDRKLPWWIAGTSIVATTFAADTPLAVAGIVAADGISGNWIWWCWAIAHVCATFFFARLWRRSGVITDAQITEVRYSGKPAAALRAFKAVYFGIFINCLTMAWVIAAMVKLSKAFFPQVAPSNVIIGCVAVSVAYTTLGGFRGVVITDVVQFIMGMLGSVIVAILAIRELGGIGAVASGQGMLGKLDAVTKMAGREVSDVLDFLPRTDHPTIPLVYFVVLLVAGWWRYAEGSGYVVQRLAACKNEAHAQAASLWFALAHNALRPWPWILVGLCGLVVYPKLHEESRAHVKSGQTAGIRVVDADGKARESGHLEVSERNTIQVANWTLGTARASATCTATLEKKAVPCRIVNKIVEVDVPVQSVGGEKILRVVAGGARPLVVSVPFALQDAELSYPLMMKKVLPTGVLGLVIASLLAAFMSTIDTHTNWGASYLVNDVYRRFFRKEEDEAHYVKVSRLCILLMAILAGVAATFVTNIASVWRFLITLGAGLGSVTAARWYWHRVTPHAEFAALAVTSVAAIGLELTDVLLAWQKIIFVALVSLATWIPVCLFGPQNDHEVLRSFAEKVKPPGPGWSKFRAGSLSEMSSPLVGFVAGVSLVFGALFAGEQLLFGSSAVGVVLMCISAGLFVWLLRRPNGQTK